MSKAAIQASVLNNGSSLTVAANAQITVRNLAGSIVVLYSTREGTGNPGNPFNANSNGYFLVYADPGVYDITVTTSGGSQVYKHVVVFFNGPTTSPTDTTPDALLKVGAGGLLNTGTAPVLLDFNTYGATGFYYGDNQPGSNKPDPEAWSSYVFRLTQTSSRVGSLVMRSGAAALRAWLHRYEAGVATQVELLHTGNVISGTYTPALTFGGLSTGIIYGSIGGTYTKKPVSGGLSEVFVQGYISLSNKGTATGPAGITLPFTVYPPNNLHYPAAAFRCNGVTYSGQFQGYALAASISLGQITEAGVASVLSDANFLIPSSVIFSMTYLTQD